MSIIEQSSDNQRPSKIINEHKWMINELHTHHLPIPVQNEKQLMRQIEQAPQPTTEQEQIELQIKMRFNYRQAVGELVYAMVTCRPDIAFPLIKLSQYSTNPAELHYKTIISIFQYLHATKHQGITYWRTQPHPELQLPAASWVISSSLRHNLQPSPSQIAWASQKVFFACFLRSSVRIQHSALEPELPA